MVVVRTIAFLWMVFVASQVGVAMAAKKKNEIAFGVSMKANVGSKIG